MKRLISLLAALILLLVLAGCSNTGEVDALNDEIDELNDTIDELNEEIELLEAQIDEYAVQTEEEPQVEVEAEQVEEEQQQTLPEKDIYTLGDTFIFNNLEITLLGVRIEPVDNSYAEIQEAVLLDITVKNLSTETHGLNMFYYTGYGSKGTKADSADAYFDDAIAFMGDMRPDAIMEGCLCFAYDGDGEYFIEFDDFNQTIEVSIQVVKS